MNYNTFIERFGRIGIFTTLMWLAWNIALSVGMKVYDWAFLVFWTIIILLWMLNTPNTGSTPK